MTRLFIFKNGAYESLMKNSDFFFTYLNHSCVSRSKLYPSLELATQSMMTWGPRVITREQKHKQFYACTQHCLHKNYESVDDMHMSYTHGIIFTFMHVSYNFMHAQRSITRTWKCDGYLPWEDSNKPSTISLFAFYDHITIHNRRNFHFVSYIHCFTWQTMMSKIKRQKQF